MTVEEFLQEFKEELERRKAKLFLSGAGDIRIDCPDYPRCPLEWFLQMKDIQVCSNTGGAAKLGMSTRDAWVIMSAADNETFCNLKLEDYMPVREKLLQVCGLTERKK